jgi:hypothetical protein
MFHGALRVDPDSACSVEWWDEWWMTNGRTGRSLKRRGHCLINILSLIWEGGGESGKITKNVRQDSRHPARIRTLCLRSRVYRVLLLYKSAWQQYWRNHSYNDVGCVGVDWILQAQDWGPLVESCEDHKSRTFLDLLSCCQFLKKGCAPCSWFSFTFWSVSWFSSRSTCNKQMGLFPLSDRTCETDRWWGWAQPGGLHHSDVSLSKGARSPYYRLKCADRDWDPCTETYFSTTLQIHWWFMLYIIKGHLVWISAGTPAVLTDICHVFSQFLLANLDVLLWLGHDCFLANFFQYIIHQPS